MARARPQDYPDPNDIELEEEGTRKQINRSPEPKLDSLEKTTDRLRRLHEELMSDANHMAAKEEQAAQAMHACRAQAAGLQRAAKGIAEALDVLNKARRSAEGGRENVERPTRARLAYEDERP